MKLIKQLPGIDRRVLLSSLAGLPLFSTALRSTAAVAQTGDPLPSWNDGATKSSILDFVARVTTQGGPGFVPVDQRIATFDNDRTLWVKQPMYVQLAFALDRVKVMAPMHPEWKTKQPFAAVLDGDMKALAASGEKGVAEIIGVTHAGMTTAEFEKITSDGDQEMLEWTTAGNGARFGLLVHHTDAVREWAYDRDSRVGKLDKALDAAAEVGMEYHGYEERLE